MGRVYKSLGELGRIITGKTPKTDIADYWGGHVPFITPTDINGYDSFFQGETERYVSAEGVKKQKATLLPPKSVCFSCIASIGKSCLTRVCSITNQQINSIIPNKENDYRYLLYLLRYNLPYIQMVGGGSGSGTPIISKNKFAKFKFLVEGNLEAQHRIASILSTYDTLIENNTKRIRLLEKMAENLYNEWFVRFRFPGHENVEMENSKYGKLPKTFEIVKMNEVFDYYIGGGWGEEERSEGFPEEASVIRGADFPNIWHYDVSSCPKRYHKAKNYKARQLEDGDIIMEISGGTSEQPVGRTVLVTEDLLERFPNKRLICASFCKLIRLKKDVVSPDYFYYWMKFLYDTRIIDRFQLQSTGIINFKFEPFLRRGDVVLPPKEVMLAFEKQVSLCHKEMNQLAKQNSLLARQRDLLLPRLMSGKLEVKEELLE